MTNYPTSIEEIRARHFPQLSDCTYLDHGGCQLAPNSLIDSFAEDLKTNLYGNPHSDSEPAKAADKRVEDTRLRALRFFGADPEEYDLIFVANATAAVKLVAESFRDHLWRTENQYARRKIWSKLAARVRRKSSRPMFSYLYHKDCHTSLVGIRELSSKHHCFLSDEDVEKWIAGPAVPRQHLTLFAYPGQSNMTGRRLPMDWPARIQDSSSQKHTYVLLDAAALAMTKELHISHWKPDFVAISFYKIFGFPDLGALIVRKATASHIMNARRYFGGGTVEMVISADDQWHSRKDGSLHSAHEDGTLPFHNIIALSHALDSMSQVYGGIDRVSIHSQSLSRQLYIGLRSLRHHNNEPVIKIYADQRTEFGNSELQGSTVAFSVLMRNGSVVGFQDVERKANEHNIYIRSGALCNPGGIATYLGWSGDSLRQAYEAGHRCSSPMEVVMGRVTGVVRASLGACSSGEDVKRLIGFLRQTYIELAPDTVSSMESLVGLPKAEESNGKQTPSAKAARLGGSDENIIYAV